MSTLNLLISIAIIAAITGVISSKHVSVGIDVHVLVAFMFLYLTSGVVLVVVVDR